LADGREIVDGIASWWTAAHGYQHPHIRARVTAQLEQLAHVAFGGLANEPAYTLAARLAQWTAPLSRVFFVESGSVAVEVALKMAIQSFHNVGMSQRRRVVCFRDAYHGDTFATMTLSDPETGMHRAFAGMGLDTVCLPLPRDLESTRRFESAWARVAHEVAAVVIEPLVQCAGGMRFHEPATLRHLRAVCDAEGIVLVFDEIATGFFRTGARFACERAGVTPDIMTLGKALSGGTLPLAAVVARPQIFEQFLSDDATKALQHGPTYMGNALACAAAHASLDLFEQEDFTTRVAALERRLRDGLQALVGCPGVTDVRALGGIGVVEFEAGRAPASQVFLEHGAFLRPLRLGHSDVLYTMPPLGIDAVDLDVLLRAMTRAVAR
jgi:adenosylmethionine-8-amino-7-oxononanoate aminotransferase